MSSPMTTARARVFRPVTSLKRPRLTIVPKVSTHTPRVPFVLLVVSVLAGGLVGLLLLNTALQSGAYQVTGLRQTSASLTVQQQSLRTRVAELQQPQRLAERAQRLGMVQNDSPAFLSLSTGAIVGSAVPAFAANKVDVGPVVAANASRVGKTTPAIAGQLASGFTLPERHGAKAPEPDDGSRSRVPLSTKGNR